MKEISLLDGIMKIQLTVINAKSLSLKMWCWMAKTGAKTNKDFFKENLEYSFMIQFMNTCALCEYFKFFYYEEACLSCKRCPLYSCFYKDSLYQIWRSSKIKRTRKKYAQQIVNKIEAWDIKELK